MHYALSVWARSKHPAVTCELSEYSSPKNEISRLTEILLRAAGHDISDAAQRLRPSAERLLDAARALDDTFEYAPFDANALSKLLANPEEELGADAAALLKALRSRGCRSEDVLAGISRLPVYPSVAGRLLALARDKEVSFEALLECATADQALAGAVLSEAETVGYTAPDSTRGILQAMMRIGAVRANTVMIEAVFRPLIEGMSQSRSSWTHSLEAAQLTRTIAAKLNIECGVDAYALGLLHDIGGLLLQLAPQPACRLYQSLLEAGCPSLLAESVAFGINHAEAGQQVLQKWGLPEVAAEAIRIHHEPEQATSALAVVLYLVEHWTASSEDLPSRLRIESAFKILGITARDFEQLAGEAQIDTALTSVGHDEKRVHNSSSNRAST